MYAFVCEAEEAESDSNLADGRSVVGRFSTASAPMGEADALAAIILLCPQNLNNKHAREIRNIPCTGCFF